MSYKIALIGNCQAKPLAVLLKKLNPKIKITKVAIVHLLSSEQEHLYEKSFAEADLIIAQQVADNYPCEFVRDNQLKEKYGDKIFSIINLYYTGYTPDLMYIRMSDRRTLRGPLGDYHNKTIFNAWKNGCTLTECCKQYLSVEFNKDMYNGLSDASLAELKKREDLSSISIVDFLKENLHHSRMFYTFNHPSNILLEKMSREIISKMEISGDNKYGNLPEFLDQFIPPVNCFSMSELGIKFKNVPEFKGVQFSYGENDRIVTGKQKYYCLDEVIRCFYDIYDRNHEELIDKLL